MKNIITTCVAACLMSSGAFGFSIVNATSAPFTVSINGYCSTEFGNVRVGKETDVSDGVIMNYCGKNFKNCVARIHELKNCEGLEIGSFEFDEEAWVQASPVTQAEGYSVNVIVPMNLVAVGEKA